MSYTLFDKKYLELKQLLIDGKVQEFEQKLDLLEFDELFEFGNFSEQTYQGKDFLSDYFGIKVLGEISYLVATKEIIVFANKNFNPDNFINITFNTLAFATEKLFDLGYYTDVAKYSLILLEYPDLNKEFKISILSYLATIANHNNEIHKELSYCEAMLKIDNRDTVVLLSYAYALQRNKQYEKAKIYLENLDDTFYFEKYLYLAHNAIQRNQDYTLAHKYFEDIGNLSNGGLKLEDRQRYLYFYNSLMCWGLSGNNELLEYIQDFKNNIQKVKDKQVATEWHSIGQLVELMNKGIYELGEGNLDKSIKYFEQAINTKKQGDLLITASYLKNIALITQESQKLIGQKLEKLPEFINEILQFISNMESNELFGDYKKILENYFELLKIALNIILHNDNSEINNRKTLLLKFNQRNITTSEFINRSFKLIKIIEEYKQEYSKTILKEITKNNYKERLKNLVNSNFGFDREVNFLHSLNTSKSINISISEIIIKTIKLIQTNEPSFIKDFKNQKTKSLLEDDFRSHFFYIFGLYIDVDAESLSRVGRTDLRLISNNFGTKTFEFKVWGRTGYDIVVKQLYEYLTDFEHEGFIFMVNPNQTSIEDKYIDNLQKVSMGYIKNTFDKKQIDNFTFFISKHKIHTKEKIIYHFILNLY